VLIRSRKPWTFARRRLFGWNVRLLTGAPQVRFVICYRFNGGQPVNGKGDTGTGQTDRRDLRLGPVPRPGHCPGDPGQVYHRGTLRFPPHIPLRRLRLWKINVRTPVHGLPAAARVAKPRYGGHSARSVPGGTLASLVRPGHARHVTCTQCGLSCGQRAWSLIRLWQHGEARGAHR
jgi:hypothetical protein